MKLKQPDTWEGGGVNRVLVACEYSGRVRDAFASKGWNAMSCDFEPTEVPGEHYQGDVGDLLSQPWDLLIAFPPCTYLCSSGMHWTTRGLRDPQLTEDALVFVRMLMDAPIERIAVENPIGCISTRIRKPDQIIQPWMFGHGETKATCLWLKGLKKLEPENVVEGRENRIWRMPPSKTRWKERSRTYEGIASAMANQWGSINGDRCGVRIRKGGA
jgi:hypothetical protein